MDWDIVKSALPFLAFTISAFALYAKWQEKPRLRVRLSANAYSEGENGGQRWRFAHVIVENPPAPRLVSWLTYRQPARNVRVELAYLSADGSLAKFRFEGRWSANPEPVQKRLVDGKQQSLFDPWLVQVGRYRDIAAGTAEDVAVGLKIEGDPECYGFTNESYRAGNAWRVPEYRLPVGTHRVEATAVSSEVRSKTAKFVLRNDGPSLSDLWLDVPKRLS